jgi:heat shock protein 5
VGALADFDDFQRHAIKEAGKIAGLTVLRVINEPTAAAIAYGLNNESQESLILVYDLGGSTLDITLLSVDDSVFDVLTTAGDSQLGGRDFNSRVLDHLTRVYWERTGADVTDQAELLWKLENQAEKAKRTLSSQQTAEIEIDSFDGGKYFSETLTRAQFEEFNADLFNRTMKFVEQALKDANVKKEEINEVSSRFVLTSVNVHRVKVVLVGGSTRIPKIQQLLEEYFTGKAILRSIAPDEVVTHGAAIQGSILTDAPNICCIMAICPLTLGIETAGGLLKKMIPRNSVIPVKKSQMLAKGFFFNAIPELMPSQFLHGSRRSTLCLDPNIRRGPAIY